MSARERAGVQVGNGHATAVECNSIVRLVVSDGVASARLDMGVDDARHLAAMLRRIARRVERGSQ